MRNVRLFRVAKIRSDTAFLLMMPRAKANYYCRGYASGTLRMGLIPHSYNYHPDTDHDNHFAALFSIRYSTFATVSEQQILSPDSQIDYGKSKECVTLSEECPIQMQSPFKFVRLRYNNVLALLLRRLPRPTHGLHIQRCRMVR